MRYTERLFAVVQRGIPAADEKFAPHGKALIYQPYDKEPRDFPETVVNLVMVNLYEGDVVVVEYNRDTDEWYVVKKLVDGGFEVRSQA